MDAGWITILATGTTGVGAGVAWAVKAIIDKKSPPLNGVKCNAHESMVKTCAELSTQITDIKEGIRETNANVIRVHQRLDELLMRK